MCANIPIVTYRYSGLVVMLRRRQKAPADASLVVTTLSFDGSDANDDSSDKDNEPAEDWAAGGVGDAAWLWEEETVLAADDEQLPPLLADGDFGCDVRVVSQHTVIVSAPYAADTGGSLAVLRRHDGLWAVRELLHVPRGGEDGRTPPQALGYRVAVLSCSAPMEKQGQGKECREERTDQTIKAGELAGEDAETKEREGGKRGEGLLVLASDPIAQHTYMFVRPLTGEVE